MDMNNIANFKNKFVIILLGLTPISKGKFASVV